MSLQFKKVESIEHLKELCEDKMTDFCIMLGVCRSSKDIEWLSEDNLFSINHNIDDTDELIDEEQLKTSNIGVAIENGRFFKYV